MSVYLKIISCYCSFTVRVLNDNVLHFLPNSEYSKCLKIFDAKVSDKVSYSDSAVPDQTALKGQGQHCLPFCLVF